MKIITRKEFLKIEGQVLYSKFSPMIFQGFEIKLGNTGTNDWVCDQLDPSCIKSQSSDETFEILTRLEEQAKTPDEAVDCAMDFNCSGRDGLYEADDTLIAVYNEADVLALTKRLLELLPGYTLVKKD